MKRLGFIAASVLLIITCSPTAPAQTRIHLATQSRAADFTASDYTKPFRTGQVLPAVCSTGEFFLSMPTGGANTLWECGSPNMWTQQGSGGSMASSSSSSGDLAVTAGATTATVGAACSVYSPCRMRFGGTVYQLESPGTATLTGGSGSGAADIYLSDAGVLVMEYSQSAGVTVQAAGMSASALATPSFPANSIPIAQVAISSGAWGQITDMRAFLAGTSLVGGNGIALTQNSGRWQVDVDPASVPSFAGLDVFTGNVVASTAVQTAPNKTGSADPLSCDPSVSETFFNTTAQLLKVCTASNVWSAIGALPGATVLTNQSNVYSSGMQDFSGAAHTIPSVKGLVANLANNCTVGEEYFATDATAGQNKYYCTAPNVWTQQKGTAQVQQNSGGGGGPTIGQGAYASLPGSCATGDMYLFTDALFPFARCGLTGAWAKFYQGKLITPAADMTLTQSLQAGVTASLVHGYESLAFQVNGPFVPSTTSWTAPAAPYTQYVYVRLPVQWNNDNYRLFYAGFKDGNGVLESLRCGVGNNTASGTWCDITYGGGSPGEAKFTSLSVGAAIQGDICVVLQDDGTALHWGISLDGGDTSSEFYSESRTAHFASGPTAMFVGGVDSAATYPQTLTFVGTR